MSPRSRSAKFGWSLCGAAILFLAGYLGNPEDAPWLNRSPLWGPGDPFYSSGNLFVADPLMIWRGTPNAESSDDYPHAQIANTWSHNAQGLRDDEITLRKPQGTVRVLNLGDSATWGLNLEDARRNTYSDQLEALLAERGLGEEYEVINAGTVGYSTLQGVQYLRYWLPRFRPDVVSVYLGNNDSAPSGAPDQARISPTGDASDWLRSNFWFLLVQRVYMEAAHARTVEARSEFEALVRDKQNAPGYASREDFYQTLARVSPSDYESNLREMVRLADAHGARLIFLKVPVNLLWPPNNARPTLDVALKSPPFNCAVHIASGYLARANEGAPPSRRPFGGHPYLSLVTPREVRAALGPGVVRGYREEIRPGIERVSSIVDPGERCQLAHNLGVWELILGNEREALRLLESAQAAARGCEGCVRPHFMAMNTYMLAACLFELGERDQARPLFEEARRLWPFAMAPDYETRFDRVVAETGAEWIDLPTLFELEDAEFWGSALMHDWVHPNARGNRVIASAILERLRK